MQLEKSQNEQKIENCEKLNHATKKHLRFC